MSRRQPATRHKVSAGTRARVKILIVWELDARNMNPGTTCQERTKYVVSTFHRWKCDQNVPKADTRYFIHPRTIISLWLTRKQDEIYYTMTRAGSNLGQHPRSSKSRFGIFSSESFTSCKAHMAKVHTDKNGALAGDTRGDDQDKLIQDKLIRLAYLKLEQALAAKALHRENHDSTRCSQARNLPVDKVPWQNRCPSIERPPDGTVVHVQLSAVEMLPQKGASVRAVKRHGARRQAPREKSRSFMPELLRRLWDGAGKGVIKAGDR